MSERNYRQLRTARADDIPATVKRIFSYLSNYKFGMLLVLVCIIISSLTNVVSASFSGDVIDEALKLIGLENPDMSSFNRLIIIMISTYAAAIISGYVYRRIMSVVTTGMLSDVRCDLFNHMQNMSVSFYDTHTHGELMNFYTNDVDTMRPLISVTLPQLINTMISLVGTIFMMFTKNVPLTLFMLGTLGIMVLVVLTLTKRSRKYFISMQKDVSNISGYAEEMIQGQKVIKVFNHEENIIKDFKGYNKACYDSSVKSNAFSGMLFPINMNISYLAYAVVSVIGAKMVLNGEMTLGNLAAFLLYTNQISGPINGLSQQFNGMMMAIAGAERVFQIIDSPTETDEGNIELVNIKINEDGSIEQCEERTEHFGWLNPKDGSIVELKGDIRLNDVTFGYNEKKTVLHNISLYAKPGQKIAFVGSTGAGKTTITNLINRFYDVNKGSITYDGIDIRDIKKSSLRSSLGVVLQDTNLFSGTVLDNIRYGNLNATDQQCIEAAKLANADSFISRLPEGYNTMLTANGANLSQGQRQLLNIARAAVADPPVLILDEATSSIDTHTERLIEKGMDKLMAGRTVFVIAHRLSTVRNSNAIIVLEHGEIIERGDHEQLLENKGRYYQLYTGKAELD